MTFDETVALMPLEGDVLVDEVQHPDKIMEDSLAVDVDAQDDENLQDISLSGEFDVLYSFHGVFPAIEAKLRLYGQKCLLTQEASFGLHFAV